MTFWSLLLVGCVLLQACIEGDEQVWIEKDGSARVDAVYRVPMMLLSEQDAQDFKDSLDAEVGSNSNLRLITNSVEREQGKRIIRIVIETDDVTQLEGVSTDADEEDRKNRSKGSKILHAILGKIDVRMDGLSAELHREVDLSPVIDEYVGKNAAMMLSDAEFRYAVHLPTGADSSNAHEVSNEGRTLRWAYGLGELNGQPIVMQMKASVPIPWWVYAAVCAVFLVILLVVWKFLLRKKQA